MNVERRFVMTYSILEDWQTGDFQIIDLEAVREAVRWRMFPIEKWSHMRGWLKQMFPGSTDEEIADAWLERGGDTWKAIARYITNVVVPAMSSAELLKYLGREGTLSFDDLVGNGAIALVPLP